MLAGVELDADHEALAADVGDQRREAAAAAGRRPAKRLLAALGGVLDQAALEQLDRGQRGGAGHRVAAEGRAVRAGSPGSSSSARATIAPSGMPEAMPLAVSRMSGSTPQCSTAHILPVRPAPDWTSSAISRMPCASQMSRRPWQEAVLRDDVAALALDRLDDDRRDLVGRRELVEQHLVEPAQVLDPAVRSVEDARQQRAEAGVVLGLRRGQRDRAIGPAVERAEEGHDVRPLRSRSGRA